MDPKQLREAEARANQAVQDAADAIDALTDDSSVEDIEAAQRSFDEAVEAAKAAKAQRERADAIAEARENYKPIEPPPAAEQRDVRVGDEEAPYRPDGDRSFFADIRASRRGDAEAAERLHRNQLHVIDHHRREGRVNEIRDVTTGATGGGGLLPPNYLASMLIDIRRERRPAADIFPRMPLPANGMTITMPRIDSGASVAVQNPEGQALSETDIDTSQLTVDIRTIGGLQDMTLQLWERSDPGMDQVIFSELTGLYDQRLDLQVLAGTGSDGQIPGLTQVSSTNGVTYTDGDPTAAELLPKVYDAIQQIATGYFAPATHIIMHPRRAAWLASELSSSHPLFQQGGFSNGVGAQNGGMALTFAGLPVVSDANVVTTDGAGTNQDEIYVVAAGASPLAEGALRFDVHDQPLGNELKVRVRVFNYVAFASERYPKSISVISGTGLVEPTF